MANRDLQFRAQLYRLGEKLTRQDLDSLTFLCREVIPVARMERVRTATDLWLALSERGQLAKHDLSFLTTLLHSIGKVNLLDDLHAHGFPPGSLKKDPDYLFLEALLKVSLSLTASEVKDLSYLFQGLVQVNPDKMFSATQMFQVLMQRQLISPTNIGPLTEGLESIGRSDATNHLTSYLPHPQGHVQRPPGHTHYHSYRPDDMHIHTPSSGLACNGSLQSNPGSYRQASSTSEESMPESSDGGLTSVQVTEEGHMEQSTFLSPNQTQSSTSSPSSHPFPNSVVATPNSAMATPNSAMATPNSVVATPNSVVATPNTANPFGFMFNPFEGEGMKQSDVHLHLLASKEGQLRQMEQEMAHLQSQLAEQSSLSERILQERSGEANAYTSNIQTLQELLTDKNHEVASLTEELHGYHATMGTAQASASFSTDDYYLLNKIPHGYCLIFNNFEFHHPHDPFKAHPNRGGANIDQSHLIQTFKYLRYEVVVKENLIAEAMQDCIFEYANKDHSCFDSFVCCVLTHGEDNVVHGADSQELNFQEFSATMKLSPTLRGKPKIFFVQACRGDQEKKGFDIQKDSPGEDTHSSRSNGSSNRITATIPQEADFFFGFATPPGNAAYRSKRHGSWFVSQLCEVLVNSAYTDNLSSIMKKVNRKVSDAYTKEGFKQCSEAVDRLRKKVHFFHFVKKA